MTDADRKKASDLSILYVEDERILQLRMQPIIELEFRTVYTAGDGYEGLLLFRQYRPDIVVTDIRMPRMDGLSMSEEIRKIDPDVPILVLSAFNNPDYLMRAVNIGVDGFIEKTFSSEDFLKPLQKHVRIQEQKKELEAASNLLEQYKKVVDAGSPVVKISPEGKIRFVNEAFCQITGYSRGDLAGNHVNTIIHERERPSVRNMYNAILKSNHWKGLIPVTARNGEKIHLDTVIVPVWTPEGKIHELIALCHDITDFMHTKQALENEKERFKQLSITDTLTGIYNRQEFNTTIHQEADRVNRYSVPLSLIIFDIDYFKRANDEWGHLVGDRILIAITKLVSSVIRRIDVFARIGGEEFAILMPSTSLGHAGFVAGKIRLLIESATSTVPFALELFNGSYPGTVETGTKLSVTCSFGVAQMNAGESVEIFFKRADDALYEAKRRGRNRVVQNVAGGDYVELENSDSGG